MKKTRLSFILLLLSYLSGRFSLDRLPVESGVKVIYMLLIMFLYSLLIPVKDRTLLSKYKLNKNIVWLLYYIFVYLIFNLISIVYSPNKLLAMEKYIEFIIVFFLILGTIYLTTNVTSKYYYNFISHFFMLVGLVYALPIIYNSFLTSARGSFSLGGPNVTTRVLFFSLISSLYIFMKTDKLKYLLLTILYTSAIVILGSRGGIVGSILALFVLFFVKKGIIPKKISIKRSFKIKYFFYLSASLTTFFILFEQIILVFLNRFLRLTFGGGKIYSAGRDILYLEAIKLIKDQPLIGHGLNSFIEYTGRNYPHNLILELIVEMGVFGMFFFLLILYISIKKIYDYKDSEYYFFSILPLYMIIVQMFSGDLYDFRYWFLWIIPLLYYEKSRNSIMSNDRKNKVLIS